MDRILIDTDIILDLLFNREPFVEDAAILLTHCESGKIKGFLTPVILSNLYYLLTTVKDHKTVIASLQQLMQVLDVLKMDRDICMKALGSGFRDFEDALQYEAASGDGAIHAILTRNTKDYRKSKIAVFTPETFLKMR